MADHENAAQSDEAAEAQKQISDQIRAGRLEEASAQLERAMAEHPDDLSLKLFQAVLAEARGDGKGAAAIVRKLKQEFPFERIRGKLARLSRQARSTAADSVQEVRLSQQLRFAPADSELKRAVMQETDDDITIARMEAPGPLAVVFTGMVGQAMMPNEIFDRFLSALGVSAIYLRDPSRFGFANGVASVPGGLEETIAHLHELIKDLGATRVTSIGFSAGGHSSIYYGVRMQADAAISFAPITNANADFLEVDGRGRLVVKRVQAIPAELRDTKPLVHAAGGLTPIHIVYGKDHWQDERHAKYLEGEPGVVLHALDCETHVVAPFMAKKRQLMPFLEEIVVAGWAGTT